LIQNNAYLIKTQAQIIEIKEDFGLSNRFLALFLCCTYLCQNSGDPAWKDRQHEIVPLHLGAEKFSLVLLIKFKKCYVKIQVVEFNSKFPVQNSNTPAYGSNSTTYNPKWFNSQVLFPGTSSSLHN
jgi:hypothetical protein